MEYERLVDLAIDAGATVFEGKLPSSCLKGICINDCIIIDKGLDTNAERTSILAEELSHYEVNRGNLLNQRDPNSYKQEKLAHRKAYEKLVPIDSIIEAFELCLQSREEFADHLGVTEEFLQQAVRHYIDRYGPFKVHGECVVYFEPLGVMKKLGG
jgi:hypothetical protein